MDKTLKFKAVNGMTVETSINNVAGFGTLLNDGTYLSVDTVAGHRFPVHPTERKRVWNTFMPAEEGGKYD